MRCAHVRLPTQEASWTHIAPSRGIPPPITIDSTQGPHALVRLRSTLAGQLFVFEASFGLLLGSSIGGFGRSSEPRHAVTPTRHLVRECMSGQETNHGANRRQSRFSAARFRRGSPGRNIARRSGGCGWSCDCRRVELTAVLQVGGGASGAEGVITDPGFITSAAGASADMGSLPSKNRAAPARRLSGLGRSLSDRAVSGPVLRRPRDLCPD